MRTIAIVQIKTPAPAKYKGAFRFFARRSAAINGETMLNKRPQKLASPAAVPLIGAGNASGVHPYSTALNMLWKKYSIAFNPMFDASVFTVAKRKSEMPMSAELPTMAHFRPTRGTAYISAPSMTPGTPQMYMMMKFL